KETQKAELFSIDKNSYQKAPLIIFGYSVELIPDSHHYAFIVLSITPDYSPALSKKFELNWSYLSQMHQIFSEPLSAMSSSFTSNKEGGLSPQTGTTLTDQKLRKKPASVALTSPRTTSILKGKASPIMRAYSTYVWPSLLAASRW